MKQLECPGCVRWGGAEGEERPVHLSLKSAENKQYKQQSTAFHQHTSERYACVLVYFCMTLVLILLTPLSVFSCSLCDVFRQKHDRSRSTPVLDRGSEYVSATAACQKKS